MEKNIEMKQLLIFDIDTLKAKELLGNSYSILYKNIRSFMEQRGFKHIQPSTYESIHTMDYFDVSDCVKALRDKYPVLDKCIKDIRQADVVAVRPLNHLFSYEPPLQKSDKDKSTKGTDEKGVWVRKIKHHNIYKNGESFDVYKKTEVKIASCKTLQDAIHEANVSARKLER